IPAHVSPVLGAVWIEDLGAARKPRELWHGRFEVWVEPLVARAAERDEVLLGRGSMHAPRDEVMYVKLKVDVLGGPPPPYRYPALPDGGPRFGHATRMDKAGSADLPVGGALGPPDPVALP